MSRNLAALLCRGVAIAALVLGGCGRGEPDTSRAEVRRSTSEAPSSQPPSQPAAYVGRSMCADCHEEQTRLWQGSDHDLAMQDVSEQTMLGDFNDVTFEHYGVSSHFSRRDGGYFVETEGPGGDRAEYRIAYLFGFYPLQQYLIEFPNGRYQTLPLCWDARPADEGGQRWFHIYPDERIAPDDELYWTGPLQNWNLQCAECHSTNLVKNYDEQSQSYATTFDEIDVSCEACHGPGSNHVAWARAEPDGRQYGPADDFGLAVRLKEPIVGAWGIDPETHQPKRTIPLQSQVQLDMCARCHARRGGVTEAYVHGQSLLQTHRPALPVPPLYHADGQIEDEVYVWGSFMQSTMFANDVRCVDCHEPHSLELVRPLEQLCIGCHLADTYVGPDHHHHEMGTPAAQCVSCHMPQRSYMVVDPRRDHSLRVPRPDLSIALGTPNACNGCHSDKSAQWATDACLEWYGPPANDPPSAAPAFHAAATSRAGADALLIDVTNDDAQSSIMRAAALAMLADQPSRESLDTIRRHARDGDPLLRMAAMTALAPYPPELRWSIGADLLDDDVRVVRVGAARVLAAEFATFAQGDRVPAFAAALQELLTSMEINADRPDTIVDRGNLEVDLGQAEAAEHSYRAALLMQPNYAPASVNLADLYRQLGDEDQVMKVLDEAIARSPDNASLHHARGLALARTGNLGAAIESLQLACELAPSAGHYLYVYAIALNSVGRGNEAIGTLEQALQGNPGHSDMLYALTTIARDEGRLDVAIKAARELVRLAPNDAQFRGLLESLQSSE